MQPSLKFTIFDKMLICQRKDNYHYINGTSTITEETISDVS